MALKGAAQEVGWRSYESQLSTSTLLGKNADESLYVYMS